MRHSTRATLQYVTTYGRLKAAKGGESKVPKVYRTDKTRGDEHDSYPNLITMFICI